MRPHAGLTKVTSPKPSQALRATWWSECAPWPSVPSFFVPCAWSTAANPPTEWNMVLSMFSATAQLYLPVLLPDVIGPAIEQVTGRRIHAYLVKSQSRLSSHQKLTSGCSQCLSRWRPRQGIVLLSKTTMHFYPIYFRFLQLKDIGEL